MNALQEKEGEEEEEEGTALATECGKIISLTLSRYSPCISRNKDRRTGRCSPDLRWCMACALDNVGNIPFGRWLKIVNNKTPG
jgi:hypothetical protein